MHITTRARCAVPLLRRMLPVLLVGFATNVISVAQTGSPYGSQAEINDQVQTAYRAGTAAAMRGDSKIAVVEL